MPAHNATDNHSINERYKTQPRIALQISRGGFTRVGITKPNATRRGQQTDNGVVILDCQLRISMWCERRLTVLLTQVQPIWGVSVFRWFHGWIFGLNHGPVNFIFNELHLPSDLLQARPGRPFRTAIIGVQRHAGFLIPTPIEELRIEANDGMHCGAEMRPCITVAAEVSPLQLNGASSRWLLLGQVSTGDDRTHKTSGMATARRHVQSIGINPDPFSRSESARWPSGLKSGRG